MGTDKLSPSLFISDLALALARVLSYVLFDGSFVMNIGFLTPKFY
jgi:NADH:ubiquinone oxidoreductase subunit D